jgi:hypothetical protein
MSKSYLRDWPNTSLTYVSKVSYFVPRERYDERIKKSEMSYVRDMQVG